MEAGIVKERIAAFVGVCAGELPDETRLADAVTESFRVVELVIGLQEDLGFQLRAEAFREVVTVGDLVEACLTSVRCERSPSGAAAP